MAAKDLGDASNLIIPAERVPVAAYQALYHKLTGKTDKLNRRFRGAYLITKPDLEHLADRLEQSTRQYRVEGQALNFTFVFHEYQTASLSSLEKLRFYNFHAVPSPTMFAVLDYDFMIVLPSEIKLGENISQRYQVRVTVTQKDDDLLLALSSSDEEHKHFDDDIDVKVDYADFAVGRALLSVVEDWVSGLRNDDPSGSALKRSRKRARSFEMTPLFAFIISLVAAASFDATGALNAMSPVRYLLIALALAVSFTAVTVWLSNHAVKAHSKLMPRTQMSLTRGDDELSDKIIRRQAKSRYNLRLVWFGIVATFVLNVVANYVSAKIF